MAKPGDIVKNSFGVMYEVIDYNPTNDEYTLKTGNSVYKHVDPSTVDDMELYRKV